MKKQLSTLFTATTLLLLTACGQAVGANVLAENQLVVAGSTTVAPLAQALADAFMQAHPTYDVEVQSMGTGAGMTATIEGVADIGLASRTLNPDELANLDYATFAIDGIGVAVHPDNPVSDLSFTQMQQLFLGEINNWSQVGGEDAPIFVVSREDGSGARTAFEDMLGVRDAVDYILIGIGSNGVLSSIEQIEHAIGYATVGLVEARDVRALSVDGVQFSMENALEGLYPFAIGFHMAFQREGVSPAAQTFLNWVMGVQGQQVVFAMDYVPVGAFN